MGIVELGERSFTSTTTVKRMCRKLGIDSYTDFRLQLSAEIASYDRMNILKGAQTPVGQYDTTADIISKVSDQNAKSIIETSTLNNPDVIGEVIQLMRNAQRIDFYGVGPSNVVARDAYIKCMRLGIPSSAIEDPMSMRMNVRAYSKGALAILISYTGETDSVIEVARELNAMGVTSVSLTSFGENRLASLCTHKLYVQSSESWDRLGGMSSRISTLNLVDVLFTALMNTSYQEYVDVMNHTNIPNREEK
jgi:DNA-binding MurR/RpiR family transcriptional regulator